MRVAIIGAGMTGLACARRLAAAGMAPAIFDKGRGIGGRLATRRVDGLQFDHGAQYVTARDAGFAALLRDVQDNGAAAVWDDGSSAARVVGVPGMSNLARAMADGLDVQSLATVSGVRADGAGWSVQIGAVLHSFDCVVITVPAPQIAGLLGADHDFVRQVADVRMAPCLTLMAASHVPPAFVVHSDPDDALAWIANDSSKPGRPQGTATAWVAQANPDFSARYLDDEPTTLTARMLPMLCDRLHLSAGDVVHASSHRWRYARVTEPLGQAYLHRSRLYAGGDWCLGPRVEAAWISGDAVAQHILAAQS